MQASTLLGRVLYDVGIAETTYSVLDMDDRDLILSTETGRIGIFLSW